MPVLQHDHAEVRGLTGLHLYHANMSNCAMRVRLLLEEKRIRWTSHVVSLGRRENLEPWYLRINPSGLVPAIVHDGVVVTESNDILYYLEELVPEPSLTPGVQAEREEMRRWVDLSVEVQVRTIKTYVYGSLGMRSRRREELARYRELQPDRELVAFHQRCLDGFTPEEIAEAARLSHELFARMEAALGGRLPDHFPLAVVTGLGAPIARVEPAGHAADPRVLELLGRADRAPGQPPGPARLRIAVVLAAG
jgi:glutathione S-transferase